MRGTRRHIKAASELTISPNHWNAEKQDYKDRVVLIPEREKRELNDRIREIISIITLNYMDKVDSEWQNETLQYYDHPQLAIQRDIFVFQCLVGCRVGDLIKMTKNCVINGGIEYIPRKTKEGRPLTVRVALNEIALEIVQRYKHCESDKFCHSFPNRNTMLRSSGFSRLRD